MTVQRLLAVDDEPINLEIIAACFDGGDYLLDCATDGEEAWSLLDGNAAYDAIILDRMMPNLDGIALLRRIKADPRFVRIPVVMQTAAGDPDQVREGLDAGAYYYLVKPYVCETLLAIVRGALDDGAYRRQLQQRLLRHGNALKLLDSAEFTFQSLEEAETLAAFIAHGCPDPDSAMLGISELLINAVEHGNLGITYDGKAVLKREGRWQEEVERRLGLPENRGKFVRLSLTRPYGKTQIRIVDQGQGFDWRQYLDFDPARACDPNGRGIALARMASFESLFYENTGNVVVATLRQGTP